ncbi:MAG: ATP-binding protein [Candidatus Dadabacteria bacterium]|nr:ATP-binding protein [Candidatus Dadabacteria bacterium]MDE0663462.1 ATP-binding protein [Candidatus Dadabacteria bacterium]
MSEQFQNPFRPGAGHPPPHLAGRDEEKKKFLKFLGQDVIMENMILTGLRGTGKTVLLDSFKPLAIANGWKWSGTDLSESASISEDNIVKRLLADLSIVTSSITVGKEEFRRVGFMGDTESVELKLNYDTLLQAYQRTPGLVSDKLKFVLELAWEFLERSEAKGLVFAYDEAQNLSDQALKEQFPLSILLEVFQSLQKKGCRLLLVLTGLPTLFPELVKARTYSERMFHVVVLGRLSEEASREAILKPIEDTNCPVELTSESVRTIADLSGGYPYFIQFICKEVYDAFIQGSHSVPTNEIIRKLDSDFFAARWARATDRQRELLTLIASLDNCDEEFTVRDIVSLSGREDLGVKPFSSSHISQMLSTLMKAGLVYRNRWGKYALAVPLMGRFIRRETGMD